MITYITKQFNPGYGKRLDNKVNEHLDSLRQQYRSSKVKVDATFRVDVQKIGGTEAETLVQFSIERLI